MKDREKRTSVELAVIISVVITVIFCWCMTQTMRSELKILRAEHEAIEQNYCPYCGTYLGEE